MSGAAMYELVSIISRNSELESSKCNCSNAGLYSKRVFWQVANWYCAISISLFIIANTTP